MGTRSQRNRPRTTAIRAREGTKKTKLRQRYDLAAVDGAKVPNGGRAGADYDGVLGRVGDVDDYVNLRDDGACEAVALTAPVSLAAPCGDVRTLSATALVAEGDAYEFLPEAHHDRGGPTRFVVARRPRNGTLYEVDASGGIQRHATRSAQCLDENLSCSAWAAYGGCDGDNGKDPAWMRAHCALSCGVCGDGAG